MSYMNHPEFNKSLITHSARDFLWTKDNFGNLIGVAEASDFNHRVIGQVFNDAADDGFLVHSPKTGVTKLFFFEGRDRDPDGDLICNDYVDEDRELTIRIYND